MGILKTWRSHTKNTIYISTPSACLYNDTPYGYGIFPNDYQITTAAMVTQCKQFDALNTAENCVWIMMHKPLDINIVYEAMVERGFKNITNVWWHKPEHYAEGHNARMIPVLEGGLVGCFPDANHIKVTMNDNPRLRPNCISIPSVTTLAKDVSGNIINPTEKPPGLAKWLFESFCPKGSTVLIIGTGAGGCVKGAVLAGMNVIGVENDEKQFRALECELHAWLALEDKPAPKPKKTKEATEAEHVSPTKAPATVDQKEDRTGEETAVVEGMCFACDEPPTEEDPLAPCSECHKVCHSLGCLLDRPLSLDPDDNDGSRVCKGCRKAIISVNPDER